MNNGFLTAAGRRPNRAPTLLWIALGVALVLVAGGFAVWFFAVDQPPRRAVGRVADEIGRWEAVTYQGTVTESPYGDSRLEATVDGAGNAYGTITRAGGRAEFARLGPDLLIKADRAWWYQTNAEQAYRLAGVWLKNPGGQFGGIPGLLATPGALAEKLRGAGPWRPDPDRQPPAPDRAFRAAAGGQVLLWAETAPVRSLAYHPEVGPGLNVSWEITAASPPAIGALRAVRSAGIPDYWAEMLKRTDLTLSIPAPNAGCDASGCHVTVRLTNSGSLDWSGEVKAWTNSAPLPSKPASCPAGQSVDVTIVAPGRSGVGAAWYFRAVKAT